MGAESVGAPVRGMRTADREQLDQPWREQQSSEGEKLARGPSADSIARSDEGGHNGNGHKGA